MILQDWWFTTLLGGEPPLQPPLRAHIKADVVIVGAGAAGLSAALRLMNAGLKVVLLERTVCGGSSTGKSAGFLTPDSELELSQLVRRFGLSGAQDLWNVPLEGIELMKACVKTHNIDCDFIKQDSLFLGIGRSGAKDVQEECEKRKELGFEQTLYSQTELSAVLGSNAYLKGVRYPNTYGINPLRYAQGVKRVLLENGVEIYESSEVHSIKDHIVMTHLGSVTANTVILCADKLTPEISSYARNVYHAQTFLSISEPLRGNEIRNLFPSGNRLQCWDSDLVYTYFRMTGDDRLLLGGGSMMTTFSKRATTRPHVISHVIDKFKAKFPGLKHLEFIQYWPGLIDSTRDLLPTMAQAPDAPWLFVVLGCVGLPWATYCGHFVASHALGEKSPDDKYYHYFSPKRRFAFPLGLEKIVGKKILFSLNNAWAKYFQVDAP